MGYFCAFAQISVRFLYLANMEPTTAELSNIVSLASLLDWAGVSDSPHDPSGASKTPPDLSSPRSDFFKHVGMGA